MKTYYELKGWRKNYESLLNHINFKKIKLSELDFTDHIKIIDNDQLNYQINNKIINLGILFILLILTIHVTLKVPNFLEIWIITIGIFLGYILKNYYYLSYLNKSNKKINIKYEIKLLIYTQKRI